MRILKVFTCGNVDDGKSTLLGRLLLDSDSISVDILHQLTEQGGGVPNLALLTDGLRAERSMGITIDVAYKFFTTKQTKYILVDTPGHPEYTRNMYAGASVCEAAMVLIDARNPIEDQTKKHLEIMQALAIKQVIFAINKMDAVGFDQAVFLQRKSELGVVLNPLENQHLHWIPISALAGENVVNRSPAMPWYAGPSILECLESIPQVPVDTSTSSLIEIQGLLKGFAYGKVVQGTFNTSTRWYNGIHKLVIKECFVNGGPCENALPGDQIAFRFADELTLERGQQWGKEAPIQGIEFIVELCWMGDKEASGLLEFILRRGTLERTTRVTFENGINTNDIQRVHLSISAPIDVFEERIQANQERIILIDKTTNATVAAGVIKQIVT
ncbi:MAG: GTP-binding protein [Flavobacteriales bacterium]